MENIIQIKIDNFEGPLDLLIHLIEKKKMDINEINISQIIDDYLGYIHAQKELNLKIKVEFLIMATDLIEIKAYSVLNRDKKLEKIENAANFLLLNMTLFFMPPTVKIIDSYDLLEKDLVKIIIIIVISTFLTMGITGKVVQMMIDYREKKGLK